MPRAPPTPDPARCTRRSAPGPTALRTSGSRVGGQSALRPGTRRCRRARTLTSSPILSEATDHRWRTGAPSEPGTGHGQWEPVLVVGCGPTTPPFLFGRHTPWRERDGERMLSWQPLPDSGGWSGPSCSWTLPLRKRPAGVDPRPGISTRVASCRAGARSIRTPTSQQTSSQVYHNRCRNCNSSLDQSWSDLKVSALGGWKPRVSSRSGQARLLQIPVWMVYSMANESMVSLT